MIKYIESYIDEILLLYPEVDKNDLLEILNHGFSKYLSLTEKGYDISLGNKDYTAYNGMMFVNDKARAKYNAIKKTNKIRLLNKANAHNGYYYIGLSEDDNNKLLSNKINNISLFDSSSIPINKNKEEVYIYKKYKYIYKYIFPIDIGWIFFNKKIKISDLTLIAYRDKNDKIIEICQTKQIKL